MSDYGATRRGRGWSVAAGVLLILFGLLAIAAPLIAGVALSFVFASLILLGSAVHFAYAWVERGAGAVLWQILIGTAYLLAALWILLHPLGGVLAMTLILAIYIGAEGVLELALFGALRGLPGTQWFLVDGLVSLVIAALILFGWPSSSVWAVGSLVGISFLLSGIARISMPVHARLLTPDTI